LAASDYISRLDLGSWYTPTVFKVPVAFFVLSFVEQVFFSLPKMHIYVLYVFFTILNQGLDESSL
jgi:hypothetical protein